MAVYKSFCLKGRFISHLVCLGYPGLEGVDPSRNGIKNKTNNKEHSQQFFEKAFNKLENLEHSVVLLLFLFTLDHSISQQTCILVWKSQRHSCERCHFVFGSLCLWHHERGPYVWQECLLWNEPTYFCSSLVESEPIICIIINIHGWNLSNPNLEQKITSVA